MIQMYEIDQVELIPNVCLKASLRKKVAGL